MRFKITIIIPLVLVLLSMSFSLLFYWQTNRQAAEFVRNQDLAKVKLDITRLQNVLYNLLTEEFIDLERAKLNLSVTAMDSNFKTLLLSAGTDDVLIANRYNWEGRKASLVSGYSNLSAEKIRKNNLPEVFYSDEGRTLLKGYYPVVLHLENRGDQPAQGKGVLYVEYSLKNKLRRAQQVSINQSLTIASVFFAVSFLIAVLLHFIISRRLKALTSVAGKVSSGNLGLKTNLTGNDELSHLSRAFDEMIERLKRDIDKRKTAESELRHVNENLEQIVEERSNELEQKKLELLETQAHAHHANKMAALGEMAGGMAHEINSPLQAITLLTYKLKNLKLSENFEQRQTIAEMIESAVYKISNIIESLRKMSRGESSDPFEKIIVHEVIDNVIGITKERYFIKGIELETKYHDGSDQLEVYCQQTLIGQVIINLLNNAYDAVSNCDEKWIHLDVYADNENIIFMVTDSGAGIDQEQKNKIFEPMYTTKPIDEGTGLGLSISMEIARKHNGMLKLDSEAKNTRFVLMIPRENKH